MVSILNEQLHKHNENTRKQEAGIQACPEYDKAAKQVQVNPIVPPAR